MRNQTMFFAVAFAICILFYHCTNATSGSSVSIDSAADNTSMYAGFSNQVDWGHHLVLTAGCGDCHTPKKMTAQGPADDSALLFAGNIANVPAPDLVAAEMAKHTAATYDNTSWIGPWGKSYSANLTPDSTGILGWTEQQFINCIRKGLSKGVDGSRPLMPPMPVASYKNFTDDELKAIFAYFKSVKPVHNIVTAYQPQADAQKP